MILASMKSGLAMTLRHKRLVLIFYMANLLFGVILMLPFRAVVSDFAGNSLMGQALAGRFDLNLILEMMQARRGFFSTYSALLMTLPAFYWLISLFLSGGALSSFIKNGSFDSAYFWAASGKYFGRFFRLFLYGLPVLAALLAAQSIETGIERLLFGSDPYQYVSFWGKWIQFGLSTIGILLFSVIFDYARIHVITSDERKMWRAMLFGIRFAFRNIGRTFSLAFLLMLLGALVLILYNPIADSLSAPNALVILTLLLVQQLYMLFRMVMRLTLFSSQVILFKSLSSDTVNTSEASSGKDFGLQGAPA